MKNPMSTEQMKQAIDDNEDGHDMQFRRLGPSKWEDRGSANTGEPLNFAICEYRRKPIIMYANIYKIGAPACHSSLADAKESAEDE